MSIYYFSNTKIKIRLNKHKIDAFKSISKAYSLKEIKMLEDMNSIRWDTDMSLIEVDMLTVEYILNKI